MTEDGFVDMQINFVNERILKEMVAWMDGVRSKLKGCHCVEKCFRQKLHSFTLFVAGALLYQPFTGKSFELTSKYCKYSN